MGHEVVHDAAVDAEGVVDRLVPLDEFLDRSGPAPVETAVDDRLLELLVVVDLEGPRCPRRITGLEDQGVAFLGSEGARLLG